MDVLDMSHLYAHPFGSGSVSRSALLSASGSGLLSISGSFPSRIGFGIHDFGSGFGSVLGGSARTCTLASNLVVAAAINVCFARPFLFVWAFAPLLFFCFRFGDDTPLPMALALI